jgi:hypothetical protein
MSASERLKRLKDLVDQLERLPPSAQRDRLLADARGRFVDVDTGEEPGPMRVPEPPPPPAAPPFARPASPARPPRPAAPPAPAAPGRPAPSVPPPARPAEPAEWDVIGELSLDEGSPGEAPGDDGPPPWRLGLRG